MMLIIMVMISMPLKFPPTNWIISSWMLSSEWWSDVADAALEAAFDDDDDDDDDVGDSDDDGVVN